MLSRLRDRFGISGTALKWFESYMENRTQNIQVHATVSEEQAVAFGVPQGSVLGPLMFISYTAPLCDIARRHGISIHLYADDTQLYISFSPLSNEDTKSAMMRLQACVVAIQNWMIVNKLKLNADKTDAILICSPRVKNNIDMPHIDLGNMTVPISNAARNIGVLFDDALTMKKHVQHTCRVAYFHIHCIGKIRHLLDRKTTEIMVNAYVTSRLDYGNSLLYGVSEHLLSQLQRVQNSAARLVTKTKRRQHITPVLIELHWLPVRHRIEYKLAVTTHLQQPSWSGGAVPIRSTEPTPAYSFATLCRRSPAGRPAQQSLFSR